jgi:hypothetical protein
MRRALEEENRDLETRSEQATGKGLRPGLKAPTLSVCLAASMRACSSEQARECRLGVGQRRVPLDAVEAQTVGRRAEPDRRLETPRVGSRIRWRGAAHFHAPHAQLRPDVHPDAADQCTKT